MLPAASSQTTRTVNAFCRLLVLYFEFVLGPAAKVNLETFLVWFLWKTLKSVCVEEKSDILKSNRSNWKGTEMSGSESAEKEESRRNGGKDNYRKVYDWKIYHQF